MFDLSMRLARAGFEKLGRVRSHRLTKESRPIFPNISISSALTDRHRV